MSHWRFGLADGGEVDHALYLDPLRAGAVAAIAVAAVLRLGEDEVCVQDMGGPTS